MKQLSEFMNPTLNMKEIIEFISVQLDFSHNR